MIFICVEKNDICLPPLGAHIVRGTMAMRGPKRSGEGVSEADG